MRVAALYDVHGNLPALEAVLTEVEGEAVDLIVVGGDFVGPLPVLERLRSLGDRVRFIRGNADRELVAPGPAREGGAPQAVLDFTRSQLSEEELAFVSELPERLELEIADLGRVLFCHATPRSDEEIVTFETPQERFDEIFGGLGFDVVVCGHTHMQFERFAGSTRVANAGSVGMAYEDVAGAFWALLGSDLEIGPDVELRMTRYDVESALKEIERAGFPDEWPQASRDEATAFFERIARDRA